MYERLGEVRISERSHQDLLVDNQLPDFDLADSLIFMHMLFRIVVAIAERFVRRFSTTAESDAVADFICLPIGRRNRNASANPDRTELPSGDFL